MPSFLGLLLLLFVLGFILRYFAGLGIGAPWLPVRKRDIEDALSLVEIKPEALVFDLGSGDGRLLMAAAKRGARVVGYELNPLLAAYSRFRLRKFGSRAHIYRQNLLDADLVQADIIFIFGITELMPKLADKLMRECRSGTRIVSFAFELPGLNPAGKRGIALAYSLPVVDRLPSA